MTKPIVIKVHGEPQGVVVPNGADYRFMAVKLGVFPLEGKLFESVAAARAAAESIVDSAGLLASSMQQADEADGDMVA